MEINFTASQKFYMTCVKRPISFFGALIGLILLSRIFITTVILLHFAKDRVKDTKYANAMDNGAVCHIWRKK